MQKQDQKFLPDFQGGFETILFQTLELFDIQKMLILKFGFLKLNYKSKSDLLKLPTKG